MSRDRLHRVEAIIAGVLRVGVVSSVLVTLFGVVLGFLQHPAWTEKGPLPIGSEVPTSLADLAAGLPAFHGPAWASLGLLLLIATPVLRVAVSVAAFAVERDRRFVGITLLVLALLVTSFLVGGAA